MRPPTKKLPISATERARVSSGMPHLKRTAEKLQR
jgi:hypothetical protein